MSENTMNRRQFVRALSTAGAAAGPVRLQVHPDP